MSMILRPHISFTGVGILLKKIQQEGGRLVGCLQP